jgi:integrase
MATTFLKLTKRAVDAATPPEKGEDWLRDTELTGFSLRIMASGSKTYQVQYRSKGTTRRISLGKHGVITCEDARKKAASILGEVNDGKDPSLDRSLQRALPSMKEVCEKFLTEHVAVRCKPKTAYDYQRIIERLIIPALGTRKVNDITRTDIAKLHHDLSGTPYQANRALSILSAIFNQCEIWGYRSEGANPCRHVKKFKEEKRETFLDETEVQRLWSVIDQCEQDETVNKNACNAFRLFLLTGCRLKEIQTLKWQYIQGNTIQLPDSKTGKKTVYLGSTVVELLASIARAPDNPYVIAGANPGEHLTDLQKPWRKVRKLAGIDSVRIHDLRHTFASLGIAKGLTLSEIRTLLGHKDLQSTARYAHLTEKLAHEAAERAASGIKKLYTKDNL